jgi:hypothetical protein
MKDLLAAGAIGYLGKPYDPKELQKVLCRAMGPAADTP